MMSQFFEIHPDNPQRRRVARAADIVREGGLIVYPSDSCYALGCSLGDKRSMERMHRLRHTDERHHFTLVCRDLSEISLYARVDNRAYRLMKGLTPGPYTFILRASHEVPRRLQTPKRKTIGLRVPDNRIAQCLLEELGEPLMSTTLRLPEDDISMTIPWEMRERLEHQVDLVIDGGYCGIEPTTIIDLMGDAPEVLRHGKGRVDWLEHA